MKKLAFLLICSVIISVKAFSQYPFSLYGPGLDGSTYQKFALYSETQYGLLFEAPLDASGNRLPITFSWRGNSGTYPLYIKSDGKIGIGTNQPSSNLHINSGGQSGVRLTSNIKYGAIIQLERFNNSGNFFSFETGAGANDDLRLYINNNWSSPIVTYKSDGTIGIGIAQPSSNLHINNPVGQSVVKLSSNNVKYGALLQLERFNSSDNFFSFETGAGSNDDLRLYVNSNWNSPIITYKSDGSVGIGTAAPAYKLDVCGTIRAKEVKVDLAGGCDFVFKADYKLMDLKTLEKFVNTNQHLPEIASEKEMIENGVNMKEMQMKLLQKIEELTLYTIDQNKKITELEKQNAKIQALEKKVEELESVLK